MTTCTPIPEIVRDGFAPAFASAAAEAEGETPALNRTSRRALEAPFAETPAEADETLQTVTTRSATTTRSRWRPDRLIWANSFLASERPRTREAGGCCLACYRADRRSCVPSCE